MSREAEYASQFCDEHEDPDCRVCGLRQWVIDIPPGTTIIPTNHRLNPYLRNRLNKGLHEVIADLMLVHRLPRLELADITLTYNPPPRLKRLRHPMASARIDDSDGLYLTAKALVDGLTKAGVFASDTIKHIPRAPACQVLPETHPRGHLILTVTEVAG